VLSTGLCGCGIENKKMSRKCIDSSARTKEIHAAL
jgi:hypothetical protein